MSSKTSYTSRCTALAAAWHAFRSVPQCSSLRSRAGAHLHTHSTQQEPVSITRHPLAQVLTYKAMEKFDLFHYHSGAMVATRDHHDFEHPGGKLAAGHVETKALDAALHSGQANMESLARQSQQHGAALNRVSQARCYACLLVSTPASCGRYSMQMLDADARCGAA